MGLWRCGLLPGALLLAVAAAEASEPVYRLPLGDLVRRAKDAPVVLDTIVDTAIGDAIDPATLARRLAHNRVVLVGEEHTSLEAHRVELQVIRALYGAGRHVTIGLEMFPYTEQASLDAWNEGRVTESEFVRTSRWYDVWGYHWGYYRDIFLFARGAHIPLVAVNAPREIVTAVRKNGLGSLPADQAGHLPPTIDVDSADHLAFFKASFDEGDALHGGMTDVAWKAMLSAQATWDGAMAWNAIKALERDADPGAVVVVLAGSGHVAFGLGIERQARAWFDGPVASVVAMPIADEHGAIAAVRASYANFVWGVSREASPAFPSLGVSTRATDDGRREIIDVEKDSPAARAGLAVGDVIVSIDGSSVDSREMFNRVIADRLWSDVPKVTVTRAGHQVTLAVPLRRNP